MKTKENIRDILVINLGGVGDILLSTPALRALKRAYPEASVAFLGVPRVCAFARGLPFLDKVISFEAYDEKARHFSFLKLRELTGFLLRLRRRRFDMLINMRTILSCGGALKMAFLFTMIGARYRAGRDTQGRGFFLNIKIRETSVGEKHEMDYDLETAAALGADISDDSLDLPIAADDERKTDEYLKSCGVRDDDALIGLHIGGMPSRRWPIENFAQVLERLAQAASAKFLISGGPGEEALFGRLQQLTSAPLVNMVHRASFGGLAAAIRKCRVFISNDTGPMHIAAALKVPLVAIFGGGQVTRFDPRRISDKVVVLWKNASCAPCDRTECDSMKCLKELSPNDVVDVVKHLLRGQGNA